MNGADGGWLLSLPTDRAHAETFGEERPELAHLDPLPAIVAREDEGGVGWQVDIYFTERPSAETVALFEGLGESEAQLTPIVPDDWVTRSQEGLEPVMAGRFRVRARHHAPEPWPGRIELTIAASRAFGTGHHDTTRGCLIALDRLARRGLSPRRIADIGTGTGLLAFAGHRLWPAARIVASDIDPVSVALAAEFAAENGVPVGRGRGRVEPVAAPGTAHRRIAAAAPFDLLIANILAGPLVALAPDFARAVRPGGTLLLAGLVESQREAVLATYRRAGFRPVDTGSGEWPTLILVRRRQPGHRRPARTPARLRQPRGDTGEW